MTLGRRSEVNFCEEIKPSMQCYRDSLQVSIRKGYNAAAQTCRVCEAAAGVDGEERERNERQRQGSYNGVAVAHRASWGLAEQRQSLCAVCSHFRNGYGEINESLLPPCVNGSDWQPGRLMLL